MVHSAVRKMGIFRGTEIRDAGAFPCGQASGRSRHAGQGKTVHEIKELVKEALDEFVVSRVELETRQDL
eukprot:1262939-Amphidinium_carterae.2